MDATNPLAELRDIVSAPAPDWWPPAPGWWLLLLAALLLAAAAYRPLQRRWRRRRQRQAALRQLARLNAMLRAGGSNCDYAAGLSALLKRAALSRRPRADIAALSGEDWIAFLSSGQRGALSHDAGELLTRLAYGPAGIDVDSVRLDRLCAEAERWLRLNL
jgi:hypothetical protein